MISAVLRMNWLAAFTDDGELAPIKGTYGMVRRGTTAYSSREDIASGNGHAGSPESA